MPAGVRRSPSWWSFVQPLAPRCPRQVACLLPGALAQRVQLDGRGRRRRPVTAHDDGLGRARRDASQGARTERRDLAEQLRAAAAGRPGRTTSGWRSRSAHRSGPGRPRPRRPAARRRRPRRPAVPGAVPERPSSPPVPSWRAAARPQRAASAHARRRPRASVGRPGLRCPRRRSSGATSRLGDGQSLSVGPRAAPTRVGQRSLAARPRRSACRPDGSPRRRPRAWTGSAAATRPRPAAHPAAPAPAG